MSTQPSAVMSGSPGGEPVSNPQQPQQPQGPFGKIGAFLKQVMPYVTPVANRLAAAAGNYGPIELEHQQREDALKQSQFGLQQQLQQSTLQNQDLQRQLTTHQIALSTPGSPEYAAKQQGDVTQAAAIEDARNLHAPPKDSVAQVPSGGGQGYYEEAYDPTQGKRVTTPKMVTTQVPNPERQPYADVAAGGKPPNLVQDWNAGPPPTMPATVPQQSQMMALQKPLNAGGDIEPDQNSPTGFSHVWRSSNFQEVHREPAPAPSAYVGSETSGSNTVLKDDGQGHMVPVQLPHSSKKTPITPSGANNPTPPSPMPPTSPNASTDGVKVGAPVLNSPQTAATRTMIEAAPHVTELADKVLGEIDQQQKSLGPAASRWNEFWTGKLGEPNPQFTQLRTDAGLLQTLLMRMHVGARGGGQIMEHFKDLINSGTQSPENLRAAIGEIKSYAADLMKPRQGPNASTSAPSGPMKSFSDWDAQQPH